MTTTVQSAEVVQSVFYATGDDFLLGCVAPEDAYGSVVDEFLAFIGLSVADLTADELERLAGTLTFIPMRSIVKADLDWIADAELGEFHTEASGKRVKPCWWAPMTGWSELMVDVLHRLKEAEGLAAIEDAASSSGDGFGHASVKAA